MIQRDANNAKRRLMIFYISKQMTTCTRRADREIARKTIWPSHLCKWPFAIGITGGKKPLIRFAGYSFQCGLAKY